ncbi:hypothetical protein QKU58_gp040 [Pyramimonas orientalis virus]|uniref:Uncharacterized protein n=1 Tax=Pyramimonas orientalis virus 01B TaxID=3134525 RepID=A0A7M3UNM2_9VIRU|nr:hypothetical protein QKU58_gp040 [Pyramimonas orientalis virus]QOI90291.1 hypothetical protein HWQ62_00154 [Pyramimonas orientalis virus]
MMRETKQSEIPRGGTTAFTEMPLTLHFSTNVKNNNSNHDSKRATAASPNKSSKNTPKQQYCKLRDSLFSRKKTIETLLPNVNTRVVPNVNTRVVPNVLSDNEEVNWNNLLDTIYTFVSNMNIPPPPIPPINNGDPSTFCEFELNENNNLDEIIKKIICSDKNKIVFSDTLITFINKVLKDLFTLLYYDVIHNTFSIDFKSIFVGILISFIIDNLLIMCKTNTSNVSKSKKFLCTESNTLLNIMYIVKYSNPNSTPVKITQVYLISKMRNMCGLPTLKKIIQGLIKNQLNETMNN